MLVVAVQKKNPEAHNISRCWPSPYTALPYAALQPVPPAEACCVLHTCYPSSVPPVLCNSSACPMASPASSQEGPPVLHVSAPVPKGLAVRSLPHVLFSPLACPMASPPSLRCWLPSAARLMRCWLLLSCNTSACSFTCLDMLVPLCCSYLNRYPLGLLTTHANSVSASNLYYSVNVGPVHMVVLR